MDIRGMLRIYLVATVIVWVAIIFASAMVLSGTDYLGRMLPILGGGAVFFVILLPGGLFRDR